MELACFLSKAEREQRRVNKAIEDSIRRTSKDNKREMKLLLLGKLFPYIYLTHAHGVHITLAYIDWMTPSLYENHIC